MHSQCYDVPSQIYYTTFVLSDIINYADKLVLSLKGNVCVQIGPHSIKSSSS